MSEARRGPPYASSPLAFLIGLLLFLGSILLFVGDLLVGNNALRSIVINALGAAVMILWAAQDTLFDPDSDVSSIGGATGTALLLYGVYLLLAGFVIGGTGLFFHEQATLGTIYIVLAVVATAIGLLIFPTSAIVEDGESGSVDEEPDAAATGENKSNEAGRDDIESGEAEPDDTQSDGGVSAETEFEGTESDGTASDET